MFFGLFAHLSHHACTHTPNECCMCQVRKAHKAGQWALLALGWHCCLSVSWQVKKTSLNLRSCSVSLVTEAQFEVKGGSIL